VPADLAAPDAADGLVGRAEEALGGLDLLVNNAAIEIPAAYTELTREELERHVLVNLLGPMPLIRRALPGMLARGRGYMVNIASLAGKGPAPFDCPYSATKAGLVGLTRLLRAEYRDAPVGFSVVCPGFIAGEGMYARRVERGFRAPRALGESPLTAAVDALLSAIRDESPELIVNQRPLRPLLALGERSPRLAERIVDRLGARRFFAAVASGDGRGGAAGGEAG
jgi:NAD(P)-dependent dehydrogenase (short-subunit alcohol dehydrogenase family)